MPTKDQMKHTSDKIESLQQSRFVRDGELVRPVRQGETAKDAFFWSELVPEHKVAVMHASVSWQGFEPDEQEDVIENVLAGKAAAHWMDGIAPDKPTVSDVFRSLGDPGSRGIRQEFFHDLGLFAASTEQPSRQNELQEIWDDLAPERFWRLTEILNPGDAAALMEEIEAIKRSTYVESEEQVAGWNYEKGEGGVRFDELPVADREVMIETYVDWDKYALAVEDEGRVIFHAAREVPDRSYQRQLDALANRQPANDNHPEIER